MNSPRKLVLNITLIVSVLLFVLSLKYKGYCTLLGCIDSAEVFGTGWFGMGVELGTLANWITEQLSKHHAELDMRIGAALVWLANPFLFISWIGILRWPRGSITFSFFAMIIALSFLMFHHVLFNDIGHYSRIISYQPGYWLWLASTAVMVAGNLVIKFLPREHHVEKKSLHPFIPE